MVELSHRMVNRLISEFSLLLICAFVLYNNDKLRKTTKGNKKYIEITPKGEKLEILAHLKTSFTQLHTHKNVHHS